MDIRVPMESIARAFGVAVTVEVPWKSPIGATGIWLPPDMSTVPSGGGQQRIEQQRIMALLRNEAPELPRGSLIKAPELEGGAVKTWCVDSTDHIEPDHVRVVLIEKE